MKSNEVANLDILRAFAVSTVLIDHLVPTIQHKIGPVSPWLLEFTAHIGHTGVLAFFVHTSLVLMYSLERLTPRLSGYTLASRFYVRRFFRIYPLSIACVVGALVLGIPAVTWRDPPVITGQIVMANLLLIQNVVGKHSVLGPLWSLPYEVQMYIVLPILFYVANRAWGLRQLFLLLLLACVSAVALAQVTNGRLNMAGYAPCFIAGVICYALGKRQRAVFSAKLWPLAVIGLIVGYCLWHAWGGYGEPVYWIGWILCLVLALGINLFQDSKSRLGNLIAHKVSLYSFGLYLLHVPVLYLVFDVIKMRQVAPACVAFFALTLLASVIVYHALEKPMVELGRVLSERSAEGATDAAPPSVARA